MLRAKALIVKAALRALCQKSIRSVHVNETASSATVFASQSISVAFNKKPSLSNHKQQIWARYMPNLSGDAEKEKKTTGLFGFTDLHTYKGFGTLQAHAEEAVRRLIDEALQSDGGPRKMIEIFDDISNELCRVADLAEFVRSTHPDAQYRAAADATYSNISQLVEMLNTHCELYARLKNSYEANTPLTDIKHMDECDRRVTQLYLIDFEQSGIHLDEQTRTKFVECNKELISVLTNFQQYAQAPSRRLRKDIEPRFQHLFNNREETVNVDTMYINSEDETFREFVYRTYLQANPAQNSCFRSILTKRKEIAKLCGFKSFAHRANSTMIMQTPENTMRFLGECADTIKARAHDDFDKMRRFKRDTLGSEQPLMQWDVPTIANRMKKSQLDLDRLDTMHFFSLGACMNGLNMIFNQLYNVNLVLEEPQPGELWNEDVYKLSVVDAKTGLLGYIYCDFYHRANKFANVDCHFTVQCSKQLDNGSYQLPIVVLHLNLNPPTNRQPSLLSFEMMENLFHEFGHAMHSMFARTRYQHVAGTRCSTDFAEVPSQLMEYYCRDPRILRQFAKHHITGETLDDDIIHKLCQSKKMFASCDLQLQILHSMLDQQFHMIDFDHADAPTPLNIVEEYTRAHYDLPFVKDTHWHLRFSHIVGYGARYYSYLVSKCIAAKIWQECFESDPLDAMQGAAYRHKMLAYGGERSPAELVDALIGVDVNSASLVHSLTHSL